MGIEGLAMLRSKVSNRKGGGIPTTGKLAGSGERVPGVHFDGVTDEGYFDETQSSPQ